MSAEQIYNRFELLYLSIGLHFGAIKSVEPALSEKIIPYNLG